MFGRRWVSDYIAVRVMGVPSRLKAWPCSGVRLQLARVSGVNAAREADLATGEGAQVSRSAVETSRRVVLRIVLGRGFGLDAG